MRDRNVTVVKNDDFRVAIYARVSSDQQAQAGTIASQTETLKDRVAKEGLKLEEEFTFVDEGYSGATLVRPALERLRDVVATGAIDRVYVHSPDRLARKYAYQVLLIDELQRCGAEVVFLNHQLGHTPEDELLLQVQGMVAEYERAKILERSRRGKLHAARRGSVNVLGGAPYGYRYVSCQEGDGQASYEILLEQARVVQQIFEWVGQNRLSIGQVCRRLQKQGVRTETGKSYWDRATVWGILKNPAYKGLAAYGKTRTGPMRPRLRAQRGDPDQPRRAVSTYSVPTDQWHYIPVPAIVSKELFDSVQEQLVENKKRNRKAKRGVRHLLQGLLVCKKCGYAYYGKPISLSAGKGKKRSYAYYRCTGTDAYRFGGQRICDNKQVRTDLLEESVWQDVCLLLSNPQRVEQEYRRRLTGRKKSVGWNSVEQLHALIKKVKRGIARLVDAYQDGLIDRTEFEPRIHKAKERLAKLQTEAKAQTDKEAQQEELRLVIGHLKQFAHKVKNNLEQADWMTRREIVRALVKRIEVDKEAVRVVYRVTPSPFAQAPEKGLLQDCLRCERTALWRPFPRNTDQTVGHHTGI
jgi:site-specific DNA recombinase